MIARQDIFAGDSERAATVPRVLSEASVCALRAAFQAHLRFGGITEQQWRRAMRLLAQEARHSGLRVEQLLVAVKLALQGALETIDARQRAAHGSLSATIVRICIEEFYGLPLVREREVAIRGAVDIGILQLERLSVADPGPEQQRDGR